MANAVLKRILEDLGFTTGEAKVYLALLELESTTLGPIVKKAGISRSKAYDILDRLVQKGVVSNVQRREGRTYQALPPETLLGYVEAKKQVLVQEEKILREVLPQLQTFAPQPKVSVMVYTGFEGFKTMIDRTIAELKKGEVYEAMGISETTQAMRHYARRIYEVQMEKKYIARSIFDEHGAYKIAERITPLHEIRVLPSGWNTPALFTVYRDTVGIHLGKEDSIISIVIKNQEIAHSFKTAFEAMWKVAKPVKPTK
ncbi:hypothetical protein HY642_02150 [Candidatus Woesearchaeota archaeon]|nr:hypothetical protein [Candidatus Woesearchaeota archaeon]